MGKGNSKRPRHTRAYGHSDGGAGGGGGDGRGGSGGGIGEATGHSEWSHWPLGDRAVVDERCTLAELGKAVHTRDALDIGFPDQVGWINRRGGRRGSCLGCEVFGCDRVVAGFLPCCFGKLSLAQGGGGGLLLMSLLLSIQPVVTRHANFSLLYNSRLADSFPSPLRTSVLSFHASLSAAASQWGLDLLWRLLRWDALERISVTDALEHAYFVGPFISLRDGSAHATRRCWEGRRGC